MSVEHQGESFWFLRNTPLTKSEGVAHFGMKFMENVKKKKKVTMPVTWHHEGQGAQVEACIFFFRVKEYWNKGWQQWWCCHRKMSTSLWNCHGTFFLVLWCQNVNGAMMGTVWMGIVKEAERSEVTVQTPATDRTRVVVSFAASRLVKRAACDAVGTETLKNRARKSSEKVKANSPVKVTVHFRCIPSFP